MTASPDPAAASHVRQTAADRAARRVRILARLHEGWSYDKIALTEDLTRERIRQIVVETLEQREVDPGASTRFCRAPGSMARYSWRWKKWPMAN